MEEMYRKQEKGRYWEEGRKKISYDDEWGKGNKMGQYISCVVIKKPVTQKRSISQHSQVENIKTLVNANMFKWNL